ncbi:MAG: hypothetical protein IT462_09610 [Planctomycetes bacterium]|nr:hypothetical protein [Planctomycetota bacterium]
MSDNKIAPTVVRDSRGTRLVIGQNVFSHEHKKVGQLMQVRDQASCVVRFAGGGETVSVASDRLTVASWEQVRAGGSGMFPKLPTNPK